MAITKRRISPVFDADDIIVDCYEWTCLSTDTLPTEGVAVNNLALILDTSELKYFDGTEWQTVGGAST